MEKDDDNNNTNNKRVRLEGCDNPVMGGHCHGGGQVHSEGYGDPSNSLALGATGGLEVGLANDGVSSGLASFHSAPLRGGEGYGDPSNCCCCFVPVKRRCGWSHEKKKEEKEN